MIEPQIPANQQTSPVAELLRLEQGIREQESLQEVTYFMVNETQTLAPCEQVVFIAGDANRSQVKGASNLVEIDHTVPLISWLESLANHIRASDKHLQVHEIQVQDVPVDLRKEWSELTQRHLLWVPLLDPRRGLQGYLVLASPQSWQEHHMALLTHLGQSYGVILAGFQKQRRNYRSFRLRWVWLLVMAMLVASAYIPVRLSVLSPAEIIAQEPHPITAPLQGVVKKVLVKANQAVSVGTSVVAMETRELTQQVELANKAVMVAQAELHQASQASFSSRESKAKVDQLKAQLALREAELSFSQMRLSQASIQTPVAGLVLIEDVHSWKGRPVQLGERILLVADPTQVEVELWVDVHDAIALEAGSEVTLFLDIDPTTPISASVSSASYKPEMAPSQTMAYRVRASIDTELDVPRIGLRGVAKSYGEPVSLFYYLLRRPITSARQWLGW